MRMMYKLLCIFSQMFLLSTRTNEQLHATFAFEPEQRLLINSYLGDNVTPVPQELCTDAIWNSGENNMEDLEY